MATEKSIHVLGFAGSLRQDSYNRAALCAAQDLPPPCMTLEVYDLSSVPFYNDDASGDPPEQVRAFQARVAASDAPLVVTPEYDTSIPGVLKNALDWASRPPTASPLDGKPLAMMGVSPGTLGTARAQAHLRQVCAKMNTLALNQPEIYISQASEKFDAEGRLMDKSTREWIGRLLAALAAWTRRLRETSPG